MTAPIKLESIRIDEVQVAQPTKVPPAIQKTKGYFLRGPISFTWLSKAAQLPGKALHIALLIRLQEGMEGGDVAFKVDMKFRTTLGVSRFAWSRGLKHLMSAGLIEFVGKRGKCARIKVREINSESGTGSS